MARAALAHFLSLPVAQRSAVILKDVLGHSLEETAETMGLDLVSKSQRRGKQVGTYFGRYEKEDVALSRSKGAIPPRGSLHPRRERSHSSTGSLPRIEGAAPTPIGLFAGKEIALVRRRCAGLMDMDDDVPLARHLLRCPDYVYHRLLLCRRPVEA